jgi:hypothetical protein
MMLTLSIGFDDHTKFRTRRRAACIIDETICGGTYVQRSSRNHGGLVDELYRTLRLR